jgi:D-alanyl-D-alanine carboxypeptidase
MTAHARIAAVATLVVLVSFAAQPGSPRAGAPELASAAGAAPAAGVPSATSAITSATVAIDSGGLDASGRSGSAPGVSQAALPQGDDPGPTPTPPPPPTPPPSASPALPATLTPELATALTRRLAELRSASGIPGIEATIIFPDGRSWRAHAGFQNYGARVPVQNATPFPIASVTKTFMAALVVQLASEGRFGLDDALVTYLPAARVDARVTIRELLEHTSGVYDFFSNALIDDAILGCRTCAWTPARSLSYVKKQLFAPGTAWSYSNTNYVLLGQLVAAVTGQSSARLMRARFFEPLGLISTFVQGEEAAPYPVVHSYRFLTSSRRERPTALWDGNGVSPFRSLATAAGSAGNVASSARDLAVWARALYGGRVLGAEGSKAMLDFNGSQLLAARIRYGLGVQEFTVAGRLAYGHGGRLLGARSAIRYLPVEGVSIAVVMNTDRGDPAGIVEQLATLALPPLLPPPAPDPTPTPTPLPSTPGPSEVPVAAVPGASAGIGKISWLPESDRPRQAPR